MPQLAKQVARSHDVSGRWHHTATVLAHSLVAAADRHLGATPFRHAARSRPRRSREGPVRGPPRPHEGPVSHVAAISQTTSTSANDRRLMENVGRRRHPSRNPAALSSNRVRAAPAYTSARFPLLRYEQDRWKRPSKPSSYHDKKISPPYLLPSPMEIHAGDEDIVLSCDDCGERFHPRGDKMLGTSHPRREGPGFVTAAGSLEDIPSSRGTLITDTSAQARNATIADLGRVPCITSKQDATTIIEAWPAMGDPGPHHPSRPTTWTRLRPRELRRLAKLRWRGRHQGLRATELS